MIQSSTVQRIWNHVVLVQPSEFSYNALEYCVLSSTQSATSGYNYEFSLNITDANLNRFQSYELFFSCTTLDHVVHLYHIINQSIYYSFR